MWTHPQYDARIDDWQRCRDCAAGASTVKAAGTRYLPLLSPKQAAESYAAYKAQAVFVNALGRTVGALAGLVSRVPPRITAPDDLPTDDITRDGEPLALFAADSLREVLTVGRGAVALDAIAGRVRWTRYQAEDVMTWRTVPGYRDRLSMVVLRERDYVPVPNHEFQMAESAALHIWRQTPEGATIAVVPEDAIAEGVPAGELALTARGEPLQEIPVVIVGVGDVRVAPDRPPLLDLADLSLARYISSADYGRALRWGALIQPFITSDEALPKDLEIGGGAVWRVPIGGSAGVVESSGASLSAMQANLNDLTARAADLGARMITDSHQQAETAEAARISHAGDIATLSGIVGGLDAGIERAMRLHADWEGLSGDVAYVSNREYFDPRLDANEITSLLAVYQAGGMSLDTLLARLQDGGVIPADVDLGAEREAITERRTDGIESTADAGRV